MSAQTQTTVLHVSARREDHGGIQSTLWHHHQRDGSMGFEPAFLSLFDRAARWPGACVSLGCRGWMSVGQVCRRFASAMAPWPVSLAVYHDGWGVEWFGPLDRAVRRLVYLHTERPHANDLLRIFMPRVDGFLSVSQSYADRICRMQPNFPAERICVLPFFVEAPAWVQSLSARPALSRPVRLGYAGRVEHGHKRLDRLPALLAALERRKIDYRFDVLGEGAYLPTLRRRLAGNARVSFSGWQTGEDYWRTIAGWDMVVLLSDYEGFSRVTMECMSCGVLPVHPDFSAAAAELLGAAATHGLYPPGDMAAAADRIATMARWEPGGVERLQRTCAARWAGHTGDNYDRVYREFLQRLAGLPARARALRTPAWHRCLPLGVYTRIWRRRF